MLFQILEQKTSGSCQLLSMAVTWHRLRVGPSDMYLTRKASFKDTLFIGMHQRVPSLGSRIVFRTDCTFTRCKHPDCFPILHVRKTYFEGLFLMFVCVHVTHWLLCQTYEIIQFFNPSSVIYKRAQVNFSTFVNICWLIQTFKYQCCGFQVHFKSISVCNLKIKSDFWAKCRHYVMGYIINLKAMFSYFPWFWIWHISIILFAKFVVYTCSICDVVTIPINACSSLFNKLKCC